MLNLYVKPVNILQWGGDEPDPLLMARDRQVTVVENLERLQMFLQGIHPFDLVVAKQAFPEAFECGQRLQRIAPSIPLLVLLPEENDRLMRHLMREGVSFCLPYEHLNEDNVSFTLQMTAVRHQAIHQVKHSAFVDELTGCYTRALFMDRVEHAFRLAKRRKNYLFAMLLIDVDKFKNVNEEYGYDTGDALLCAIGGRLNNCLRSTDTIARLGQDEFGVLLEDLQHIHDATLVSERLQQELMEPYGLPAGAVSVTPSVGVSLSTSGYDYLEAFIQHAEHALTLSKMFHKAK